MMDETADARDSIRSRATALHTSNVFDVLLSLSSGTTDTDPDWYAVNIETYPRAKLSEPDDLAAAAKMNVSAAGTKASATGKPRQVTFSGQVFARH